MSVRGSVRALLGLSPYDLRQPNLVSFHRAVVGSATRHYRLTEPFFDGANWHQIPARFLSISGSYRFEGWSP